MKFAVTWALQAVKQARPLSLQSGFEQRMGCLADIARSAHPHHLTCSPLLMSRADCTRQLIGLS